MITSLVGMKMMRSDIQQVSRSSVIWRLSIGLVLMLLMAVFMMANVCGQDLQIATKCEKTGEKMTITTIKNCTWVPIYGWKVLPPKPDYPIGKEWAIVGWNCTCTQYTETGDEEICQNYIGRNNRLRPYGSSYRRLSPEGTITKTPEKQVVIDTIRGVIKGLEETSEECDPCRILKNLDDSVCPPENESTLPEKESMIPEGSKGELALAEDVSVPAVEVIKINWSSIHETYGPIKVPPKEEPAPTEEVPAPPEVVLEKAEVELVSPVELANI